MATNELITTVDKLSGTHTARVMHVEKIIHPVYKKRYAKTSRLLVDTGTLSPAIGDIVSVAPTRPISKHKSWIITKIHSDKSAVKDMQ